ncbi:MAG: hypothetical protein AB7P37_18440 [Ramlibacter sp.]
MRLFLAAAGLTWMGWALIGIVSGHMFFMISRAGPIHFAGIPALVFCCAVLAGAVAIILPILDHYDRRDNEAAYRDLRRWLWWAALSLVAVAMVSRCSPLAGGGQDAALLPPERLQKLLVSDRLDRLLRPWGSDLMLVMGLSSLAAVVNMGLARLVRTDWRSLPPTSVFLWLNMLFVMIFTSSFFLMVLRSLAIGEFSQASGGGEALSFQIAWMHSLLLASGAVVVFIMLALAIKVCRHLGMVTDPPEDEAARS